MTVTWLTALGRHFSVLLESCLLQHVIHILLSCMLAPHLSLLTSNHLITLCFPTTSTFQPHNDSHLIGCPWEAFFNVSSGWYLLVQFQLGTQQQWLDIGCLWEVFFNASRVMFAAACYPYLLIVKHVGLLSSCYSFYLYLPIVMYGHHFSGGSCIAWIPYTGTLL